MKRVLFLEDNNDLCKIYAQIIAHEDGVTAEFRKTADEIRAALSGTWDLIIADLDIPGIRTDEILSLAKSRIVFLTGGDPSAATGSNKVYRKENLITTLPKLLEENLR